MEVVDFCDLMKDSFKILSERSSHSPKHMRFIAPPLDAKDPSCKSTSVQTHGHVFNLIKGPNIEQVLRKFDKTEDDFKEAYNAKFGGRK